MRIRHKFKILWIGVGLLLAGGFYYSANFFQDATDPVAKKLSETLEARFMVAKMVEDKVQAHDWSHELNAEIDGDVEKLNIKWTLDENLQKYADSIFKSYKPDFGAVFLFDVTTGRVLALSSFEKGKPTSRSLALRATYPAASIFKVITATAAVDQAGLKPGHTIRFNGGNYTLYRKNVMNDKINRWTRTVTLKDAFSKSLNTAFGRLALETLEPEVINEYANRFMFNQDLATDFPVEKSIALVPSEKNYELTQVASGFNKFNRLSPVAGAMIASAIVNNGRVVVPYLVDQITDSQNQVIYSGETLEKGQIMAEESASKMRTLMEETVLSGTSRKSFRSLVRSKKFREVQMGGKTGHLTGDNPKGRTDWFVGYAFDEEKKLAVAAITVNEKYWTIKSAQVAQMLFKRYFEPVIAQRTAASEAARAQIDRP